MEGTVPVPAPPEGFAGEPLAPAPPLEGEVVGVPTLPIVPAAPVCGAPLADAPLAGAWPIAAGSFEQPLANNANVANPATITDVCFA
jgi:hypothetical protein